MRLARVAPWAGVAFFAVLAAAFIAFIVLMDRRDRAAEDRCHAIGGDTWDYGEHCVIGGAVVNTQ